MKSIAWYDNEVLKQWQDVFYLFVNFILINSHLRNVCPLTKDWPWKNINFLIFFNHPTIFTVAVHVDPKWPLNHFIFFCRISCSLSVLATRRIKTNQGSTDQLLTASPYYFIFHHLYPQSELSCFFLFPSCLTFLTFLNNFLNMEISINVVFSLYVSHIIPWN